MPGDLTGFVKEKTIQVSNSKYNDGLYLIEDVLDNETIVLNEDISFITANISQAVVTLVEYPKDIVLGMKKLLKYDAQMGNKMGIKSETISRWTVSYYDQNASESVNGYPAAMMKFINKYKKLRW